MKGWKYDARIKVRPMQRWSGGGGIVVQKWREGGESANTSQYCLGIVVQVHYRLRPIERRP